MRILVIADANIPVPPEGYGGTERIVALLCEGLAARGHRVTLMAARGSRNYGRLIAHRSAHNACYVSRAYRKMLFQMTSFLAARKVDIVHNFGRIDYLFAVLHTQVPLVARFGNPINEDETDILLKLRTKRLALVSVSNYQRAHLIKPGPWTTIYNGTNVDRFEFRARPHAKPYLAFLGLLTPDKEVHIAIRVARACGIKLKIAGKVPEKGASYFATEIRPHLGPSIEYIGEVDHTQKVDFLGQASALINPGQRNESCANVVLEALACGTPVVALNRASMPELIAPGRTGFLCNDETAMTEAIGLLHEIDRAACRADCEARFSAERMTDKYIELYEQVVNET